MCSKQVWITWCPLKFLYDNNINTPWENELGQITCCLNHSFLWPLTLVQAQKSDPLKSRHQVDLERAHFLVTQAFEEDEKGNDDEAIELYTQAVELCIKTVSLSLGPFLFFIMSLTDLHLDFPHIIPTRAHINSSSWFLLFVLFSPVQWNIWASAAEQTETAGTSSFRQVHIKWSWFCVVN